MITTPANRQFVHPPRHGLKTESVPSMKPEEKNKTDSPTHLKVANRSGLVVEGSPARAEAQRGEREKGGDYALGVQGRSPGTPLDPFVVKRKDPRVWAG